MPPSTEAEELTRPEQFLADAPSRPRVKDTETIVRAVDASIEDFNQFWNTDPDLDKLRSDLVSCIQSSGDTWEICKKFEAYGWPMHHDVYMRINLILCSLESHRITREAEWVLRYGVRFPASPGDRVVFNSRGSRLVGTINSIDSLRARSFVEIPVSGKKKPVVIAVRVEDVMMIEANA